MTALLNPNVDAEAWRERLLEPDTDAEPDNGRETAVGNSRGDKHRHGR